MSTILSSVHAQLPSNALLAGLSWAAIVFTSIIGLNVAKQLVSSSRTVGAVLESLCV